MRSLLSRRHLLSGLGFGLGALVLPGCGRGAAAPRDALVPTPSVDDGDGDAGHAPPHAAPACALTADNIEGPFYKPGAPPRAVLVSARDRGERLTLTGTVRDPACAPLANATLDIWHADARGAYDNDGWGLRGTLATDAAGRWRLDTIVPGRYLNGRRYRPMHIHVKARAAGHRELTTQLYFAGDEYLEGDPFVVASLVMPHRVAGGVRRAAYDLILGRA